MARNFAREDRLELQKKLDRARPDYQMAIEGRRLIQRRTARHRDKHGRFFVGYSKGYLRRRLRKGQSVRPNLADTGRMMGRLEVRKMARKIGGVHVSRIQPKRGRDQRLLEYHVFGRGNNPVRDPMGLTRPEQARVLRAGNKAVSRIRLSRKSQRVPLYIGWQ